MKRVAISILLLCALSSWAQNLLKVSSLPGKGFYEVPSSGGEGHVYIFDMTEDAVLTTQDGSLAQWYELPGDVLVADGYSSFSLAESGKTYRVAEGGRCDTFAIVAYNQARLSDQTHIYVSNTCDKSLLNISLPKLTYTTGNGTVQTILRPLNVNYNNEVFDQTDWQVVPRTTTLNYTSPQDYDLGETLLTGTAISVCDSAIANALYAQSDCHIIDSASVDIVAIDFCPRSYAVTRNATNEVDRPIEETVVSGSAPLNIQFKSHATSGVSFYKWNIKHYAEELSSRTEADTRYQFEQKGSYTVLLTIGNEFCTKDTTFTIEVKESLLAVPNVFTPNGDGVNDEFRVAYRSLKEFHCWIYNRWGHLVYKWDDPAKGWDGNVHGRPAPVGAYYYIIEAVGTDGEEYKPIYKDKDRRKLKQYRGAVNLLR